MGGSLRRPLGTLEFDLGHLPFDELADLAPDGVEHLEQSVVSVTVLRAEKLHDAQESAGSHDGEAERAVEAILGRALRPGKFGSRCTSTIQAGRSELQIRPGRPTPDGNVMPRLWSASACPRRAGAIHVSAHRSTFCSASTFQRTARLQSRLSPMASRYLRQRLRQGRRLGEDVGRRVLGRDATFAGLARQVRTVQRSGRCPDEGGEQEHGEDHHHRQPELGRKKPSMLTDESQPAEEGWDQNGGGQEPARENPSRTIGTDDRGEAASRAGQQDSEGEHEERHRRRQRHGNVAGEAVQGADAVGVAKERGQSDRGRNQEDELPRP